MPLASLRRSATSASLVYSARSLLVLASLAVASLGDGCTPPPPPFDQQLLENPGFEAESLAPWGVEYGSCTVAREPFADADPHGGTALLHGGYEGAVSSCRVWQDVSAGAFALGIDFGTVSLEASAWLRSWLSVNNFDDQMLLRVRYLDDLGHELSSIRTLVSGDDAWLLREASGLIPPKTRKLRVELEARHRRGTDNDGMADDASIIFRSATAADPVITKLPMLQDFRRDAMTVLWETDANLANHVVEWGPAGGLLSQTVNVVETTRIDATHYVHRATIEGLSTQTEYDYRVKSGATVSAVYRFRTAPAPSSPYKIVWLADNQNGPSIFSTHVSHIAARHPDLLFVAGDTVQGTLTDGALGGSVLSEWQTQWWDPLTVSNLGQTTPVLIARGNHDGEHPYAYAYTALPENESWYSFSYGNAFIVVLDTETTTGQQTAENDQLAYLQQALASPAAAAAEFKIVVFHRPPWTRLWDLTGIFTGYNGETWVRNDWAPIMEAAGVDLVICGHSHSYQRGVRNGTYYLIVGGGGGTLDTYNRPAGSGWPTFQVVQSTYHYNLMETSGNVLTWTTRNQNDAVVDSFQIVH